MKKVLNLTYFELHYQLPITIMKAQREVKKRVTFNLAISSPPNAPASPSVLTPKSTVSNLPSQRQRQSRTLSSPKIDQGISPKRNLPPRSSLSYRRPAISSSPRKNDTKASATSSASSSNNRSPRQSSQTRKAVTKPHNLTSSLNSSSHGNLATIGTPKLTTKNLVVKQPSTSRFSTTAPDLSRPTKLNQNRRLYSTNQTLSSSSSNLTTMAKLSRHNSNSSSVSSFTTSTFGATQNLSRPKLATITTNFHNTSIVTRHTPARSAFTFEQHSLRRSGSGGRSSFVRRGSASSMSSISSTSSSSFSSRKRSVLSEPRSRRYSR